MEDVQEDSKTVEVPGQIRQEVDSLLEYNDVLASIRKAEIRNVDAKTIDLLKLRKGRAEEILENSGIEKREAMNFVNAYNSGREAERLEAQGKKDEANKISTEMANFIANLLVRGWNAPDIDARLEAMHQVGSERKIQTSTK